MQHLMWSQRRGNPCTEKICQNRQGNNLAWTSPWSLHKILSEKLEKQVLSWIEKWLSVPRGWVIGSVKSHWKPETSGVPWGCPAKILANDLLVKLAGSLNDALQCTLSKFMDDIKPEGSGWLTRRTLTDWSDEQTRTLRSSTGRSLSTWGATIPGTRICWGPPSWKDALQERTWGSWWI